VSITPAVVIVPLLVGTLVTVFAAMAPARAASRVAPLAALRPADAPGFTKRRSLARLILTSLMTIGGAALLGWAVVLGSSDASTSSASSDATVALGVGLLGGALSFVGVLVGAVFWVPSVVGATGRLFASTGMAATLAVANTVRNPRRTAATSAALLIGVTLVTMMSTGAASARATLNDALDSHYPVDVMIRQDNPGGPTHGGASFVTPRLLGTIAAVPGVAEVIGQRGLGVQIKAKKGQASSTTATVIGVADAKTVMRSPSMVAGLDDSSVIVSPETARTIGNGFANGDVLTVTPVTLGADGVEAPSGKPVQLKAIVSALPGGLLFTPAALTRMGVDMPANEVWTRLSDVTEAGTIVPAIQDALSETTVDISGAGVERAQFQRIIDTLLAIVVGLLAVAVLIALIGVANTLSLSVIERRRESATLRAIGMSRRQLRTMLAIEGMVIAGVGAIIGATLGTLYGWVGAGTVLGAIGEVHLAVPWLDLGLVVVVALIAGLLASVIPGRAAARTSPVAALAVD
jgi:putative ABC transport system permease protein